MRRAALVAAGVVLLVAGRGLAQAEILIEDFFDKPMIAAEDRQRIREWLEPRVRSLTASTDPELKGMLSARDEILEAGRTGSGRSDAFVQAFGEEAIAALEGVEKNVVSPEARLNFVMTVAELDRIEGIPLLLKSLQNDPYPASRYWAAKGLAKVADRVVERILPRAEQRIAEGVKGVFETETSGLTLSYLFEALGRFDHEEAHDVLALGAQKVASRVSASDPAVARALVIAIRSLRQAYGREVRPEAKTQILTAYAVLCAWIMPPVGDRNLMVSLDAALEQITNDKVGFTPDSDPLMQKLSLVEWIELLVKKKFIPKRPALPPEVEEAVKSAKRQAGSSPAAPGEPPA